jgi:hypothetical protein
MDDTLYRLLMYYQSSDVSILICTQYFIVSDFGHVHKVRIYKEYHSVCPLVGIGTLPSPNPSFAS